VSNPNTELKGASHMSNLDDQSELQALQTLLNRGVITQEQFNQLSAGVDTNATNAVPPLPPPIQSKSWGKKKIATVSMMVFVLVAIGIGLVIKQQQDSQRQDAEEIAQEAREEKEREERELRAINQKACTDRASLATAWEEYVGALNKNNDASRASSLLQARRWSLEKSDATSAFRQVLKQVDHPDVASAKDKLLRQVNLLEDAHTLMGGAGTWSEFNSLITSKNLLLNDLNEYREDIFDAIIRACNGTNE
jgi:hypothetical protein